MNLNFNSFFRIIGIILALIGLSMTPSFIVSLIYDSPNTSFVFLATILVSFTLGILLLKRYKHNSVTLRVKDGFLIVTVSWFLAAAIAVIPFVATGYIPNIIDAFFETCSGFSTTGSTILSDIEILPKSLLFWRSFTHWLGGMGILIFAIALMPSLGISGQNIAVSESPGPSLDKTSSQMSTSAKSLYTIYIVFTIIETILLKLGGMNLFDALIHTFGTVGTGGFSSYNDSIAHFDSTYIRLVITFFMFICGVNFNLYYNSIKHGISSLVKDAEFRLYLAIISFATVFVFLALMFSGVYTSIASAGIDSIFQVVSILTTTCYITADYETWPIVCQIMILLLIPIGGCSASTGGGLKIIRVLVLLKLIRRGVSQRLHPNSIDAIKLNGKTIPSDTITAITAHTYLYIAMVFVGALLISLENVDFITSFSSVMTCLGNVGPGFSSVGPVSNFADLSMFSKFILSIYMIAGRLELYTFFVLLTPRFWNQNY